MEMDGDERLKLAPLYLGQVLCCDINEHIQHLQEDLVSVGHDFLVTFRVVQGNLSISGPDELDSQDANLQRTKWT